jgi:hypothetical protein
VEIKEEHKELTGFSVPSGHYEFNRLPFVLSNSPANFQRLMDTVLKDLVVNEWSIYIDDIVVFSGSRDEHARRIEYVLQRFERANHQLHPGKCLRSTSGSIPRFRPVPRGHYTLTREFEGRETVPFA